MAEDSRLGPKVGSCLALFCIYRVSRMNSRSDINIFLVLLLLFLDPEYYYCYYHIMFAVEIVRFYLYVLFCNCIILCVV